MAATTPGRRLGRYHLVEPLGCGPNGEVYRAKVVGVAGMERQLAIKRFFPAVTQLAGVSAKLSQAARTYGALDHPRIARLAELGVAGGDTFTAVELVVGLDLARLLTMGVETGAPLPPGAALGMVSAAARAIGYAHGRGVAHLGMAPTNVIATPDGDVQITDIGILACRLPTRPASDASLLARLPYLAPEQLIGDPVSAATDVFALGVIAHELVTGARPFGGASALEVEQAILSGKPATVELPRPIARVLDRCLARSPFERFPDARALADALDAALRLADLAGGKAEVGERVTEALAHIARINEQQLSGALSFAVPTPPVVRPGHPAQLPLKPPILPRTAPSPRGNTPPPIPPLTPPPSVSPPAPPRGMTLRQNAPPMPRHQTESTTNLPTLARDDQDEPTIVNRDLVMGDDPPSIEPMWPPTEQVKTIEAPLTGELAPPVPRAEGSAPQPVAPPTSPPPVSDNDPTRPLSISTPPPMVTVPMAGHDRPVSEALPYVAPAAPEPRRSIAVVALVLVALTAVAAVAGYAGFRLLVRSGGGPGKALVTAHHDAGPAARAVDAGARAVATGRRDAGARAAADAAIAVDAGASVDAGAAAVPAPVDAAAPPGPADKLVITSVPPGARVFLDGADQGRAPATIAGSRDRLNLAVFEPGYALYLEEIDGRGAREVRLEPVPAWAGPGGIKVRCKNGGRYYVFLDGKPTGQLCPTDRVPVNKGEHQVEIYDLLTEARRQFKVKVVQLARSTRLKID